MTRPLVGFGATTMSSYRIDAIMQWQKEGERRKQAKEEATQLPAESDEAFLARVEAMPEPRTWLQYATDPAGDGARGDLTPTFQAILTRSGMPRPTSGVPLH